MDWIGEQSSILLLFDINTRTLLPYHVTEGSNPTPRLGVEDSSIQRSRVVFFLANGLQVLVAILGQYETTFELHELVPRQSTFYTAYSVVELDVVGRSFAQEDNPVESGYSTDTEDRGRFSYLSYLLQTFYLPSHEHVRLPCILEAHLTHKGKLIFRIYPGNKQHPRTFERGKETDNR